MNQDARKEFEQLLIDYPALDAGKGQIEQAFFMLRQTAGSNGVIYVCGNGGSAADSEHIVGELMKSFKRRRGLSSQEKEAFEACCGKAGRKLAECLEHSIPAVSLVSQVGISTAFANDVGADAAFAQQVYGYGKAQDLLWAISTSGNSSNVANAVRAAKVKQMNTIAMTGERESILSALADVCIRAPSADTAKVQEYHLPIYHCLCAMLEAEFYNGGSQRC